jgi:ATP-dependent Lon protease
MIDFDDTKIPVVSIRNAVIFPETALPLRIGRTKSKRALEEAKEKDRLILVLLQHDENRMEEPTPYDLYWIGSLCKIERIIGSKEEGYQVVLKGLTRFQADEVTEEKGFIQAKGKPLRDIQDTDPKTSEALLGSLKDLSHQLLRLLPADTEALAELIDGMNELVYFSHVIAANLELPIAKRQQLLEMISVKNRCLTLLDLMQTQKSRLQIQNEIQQKLSKKLGKGQREAILREQLHAIREELGEGKTEDKEEEYEGKIEKAGMPEDVKKNSS